MNLRVLTIFTFASLFLETNSMMMKVQNSPWEIGRFLKTAAYYNALIPKLPFFPSTYTKSTNKLKVNPGTTLWKNGGVNENGILWGPLDDVVMGGASKTDLAPGEMFNGKWVGFTTTANNGGFAGIRTKLFKTPYDVSTCTGLVAKISGDGQRYKFIIRDDDEWNGIAWSTSFDTIPGKAMEIKLPFDKFKPTRFARVIYQSKPFNKSTFSAMQISLSKFEYDGNLNPKFREGPFQLNVQSIATY